MKLIESKENKIFKMCKSLKLKKHRQKQSLYLIEGEHLVQEACNLSRANLIIKSQDYMGQKDFAGVKQVTMSNSLFNQIAQTESSQGIITVARIIEPTKSEFIEKVKKNPCNVLILDGLQDPGNIGTIIRTAVGAGYGGVLATKGTADVYGDKAIRAASSGLLRIPILTGMEIWEVVEILREANKKIIGADPRGAVEYQSQDMAKSIGLIIGNEGNGISERLLEQTDINVKISMAEGLESLNAAVAAGILMYHGKRRTEEKGV